LGERRDEGVEAVRGFGLLARLLVAGSMLADREERVHPALGLVAYSELFYGREDQGVVMD